MKTEVFKMKSALKKSLFSLGAFLMLSGISHAYSWSDFGHDLVANSTFTFAQNATPAFFRDITTGQMGVGFVSSIQTLYFVSLDGGMVKLNDTDTSGNPIVGANIHLDQVITTFFPSQVAQIKAVLLPTRLQGVFGMLNLGICFPYSFNGTDIDPTLYSGLELKFN